MPFCTILSPAIIVGITLSYTHIIHNEDYNYWFYITVEMTADYITDYSQRYSYTRGFMRYFPFIC